MNYRQIYLVLGLFQIFACGPSDNDIPSSHLAASRAQPWMVIWDRHVKAETAGKTIQEDCRPRMMTADPRRSRQGMVMLLHGFSACPNQYFEIGNNLANLGWDVFIPLLPGHGRQPFDGPGGERDNFIDLPSTAYRAGRFRNDYPNGGSENIVMTTFVKEMSQLAATVRGPRTIAGLSGGGAYGMGIVLEKPELWDRVLLHAPYYRSMGLMRMGTDVLNALAPETKIKWPQRCFQSRRNGGRPGLCAVSAGSAQAMVDFGLRVAEQADNFAMPVQIAGVEADQTADNSITHDVYQNLPGVKSACLYKKGVPHYLLNPRGEDPKQDPFWEKALHEDSVEFLSRGQWFGHTRGGSASAADFNLPICRI